MFSCWFCYDCCYSAPNLGPLVSWTLEPSALEGPTAFSSSLSSVPKCGQAHTGAAVVVVVVLVLLLLLLLWLLYVFEWCFGSLCSCWAEEVCPLPFESEQALAASGNQLFAFYWAFFVRLDFNRSVINWNMLASVAVESGNPLFKRINKMSWIMQFPLAQ